MRAGPWPRLQQHPTDVFSMFLSSNETHAHLGILRRCRSRYAYNIPSHRVADLESSTVTRIPLLAVDPERYDRVSHDERRVDLELFLEVRSLCDLKYDGTT